MGVGELVEGRPSRVEQPSYSGVGSNRGAEQLAEQYKIDVRVFEFWRKSGNGVENKIKKTNKQTKERRKAQVMSTSRSEQSTSGYFCKSPTAGYGLSSGKILDL